MLAGIVNIQVIGPTLTLIGDGDNNQVEIHQTTTPGQYNISSPDDTLFILNGFNPPTFPELTVNGIAGNIAVELRNGNDLFRFLGVTPGVPSTVPDDLIIHNWNGSDVNEIIDTIVNGDVRIDRPAAYNGYSELLIKNSTVLGDTYVNNVGDGTGTTKTVIDNSKLQGGGPTGFALFLANPSGSDTVDVLANSQFGTGNFISATQPIIFIDNSHGPSRVTFSGSSQVAGPGTTTVYGGIVIMNGINFNGTYDILTFNSVNVLGYVDVFNFSGDTDVMVINSTLGSQSVTPAGGPLTIENFDGYDSFFMKDSHEPWGVLINNDVVFGNTSLWGSSTNVTGSTLGTLLNPLTGLGLQVLGDGGNDTVIVASSTIAAQLDVRLYNGVNSVTLLNNPQSIAVFNYAGGNGNDTVTIDNTRIIYRVNIYLYDGADRLEIRNMNYANQWPTPLLDTIIIDGGQGVDTFAGVIPPFNTFDNFEFFLP